MYPDSEIERPVKLCPYAGLSHDPKTYMLFPSERNLCHRVQPPMAISGEHQQSHCLTTQFQTCPVFLYPASKERKDFLYRPTVNRSLSTWLVLWLGIIAFALILLVAWRYQDQILTVSNYEETPAVFIAPTSLEPQPANTPEPNLPLDTLLATATATSTAPVTPLAPTLTASVTAYPGLGTPIGSQPGLIIHQVGSGDSLSGLANRYGTTEDAIRSVNLDLRLPLLAGDLIVIPASNDIVDLPIFTVYQVMATETGMTLQELSMQFATTVALLAEYNDLPVDGVLQPGRWILVPLIP
jgi:LysM repeat protein